MRRRDTITALEEHSNVEEILGVLAQLPHIGDGDLVALAATWRDHPSLAGARDRALSPEAPLVVEVLTTFEGIAALFAEDLAGEADYLVVDPAVVRVALRAVRDAVAAAYARPVLSRGQHAALLRPWRAVFPVRRIEPDLGPRSDQVKTLLGALPLLSARCHDARAAALYDALLDSAWTRDPSVSGLARETAFRAAVLSERRRVWALVRRSGTEGLGRRCPTCPAPVQGAPGSGDEQRVLTLCLDAACALVVADQLPAELTDVLTAPLTSLIPLPRLG